jgi:hypothetical protein
VSFADPESFEPDEVVESSFDDGPPASLGPVVPALLAAQPVRAAAAER